MGVSPIWCVKGPFIINAEGGRENFKCSGGKYIPPCCHKIHLHNPPCWTKQNHIASPPSSASSLAKKNPKNMCHADYIDVCFQYFFISNITQTWLIGIQFKTVIFNYLGNFRVDVVPHQLTVSLEGHRVARNQVLSRGKCCQIWPFPLG